MKLLLEAGEAKQIELLIPPDVNQIPTLKNHNTTTSTYSLVVTTKCADFLMFGPRNNTLGFPWKPLVHSNWSRLIDSS